MSHPIDLHAYANRIRVEAQFRPDLETLKSIMMAHVSTVPFENLHVLLKRPVLLDPQSLEHKIVQTCRGGYCFEQNGFLLLVLKQIGFDVTPLSGRVRIGNPRDYTPPRTHLFLRVMIEDVAWLADVGVGGMSLTAPIRFDLNIEQETPHETRRIVHEEGKYFHQALLGQEWADVYEFTGEEMPEIDRETASWWTSTSPKAKFSQNLTVARAVPDGTRYGIFNDRFTHRRGAELLMETTIQDEHHLHQILNEHFGLTGDPPEALEPCISLGKAP